MATILIVYATVEGQSRRIAELARDHLVRARHKVIVLDSSDDRAADVDVAGYDAVILVAPVHLGVHHASALRFVRSHAEALTKMPSAFISVSLHAASGEAEDEEDMRGYVDIFCASAGWLPRSVHYAAGALKFTEFDFFKRWMARRLVKSLQMNLDPKKDLEFTDWPALYAFLDRFVADQIGS